MNRRVTRMMTERAAERAPNEPAGKAAADNSRGRGDDDGISRQMRIGRTQEMRSSGLSPS